MPEQQIGSEPSGSASSAPQRRDARPQSPAQAIALIMSMMVLAEIGIMFAIEPGSADSPSGVAHAILDGALLALITVPAFLLLVYRPLARANRDLMRQAEVLEEQKARLEEARAYAVSIVNSVPDMVFVTGSDGTLDILTKPDMGF